MTTKTDLKHIALIAHDNKKADLVHWVTQHKAILQKHKLYATGTTGSRLEQATGLPIEKLKSGPLGGDLQIGSKIADGEINCIIFLWDPMAPHPHDVDVKALLRIAVLYNIPLACNLTTAGWFLKNL